MDFFQSIIILAIGFVFGYGLFLYYFHKSEILHLLEIIKEDISNLTITLKK